MTVGWIEASGLPPGVRGGTTTRDFPSAGPGQPDARFGPATDAAGLALQRRRLGEILELPGEPLWLRQVHGTQVHVAASGTGAAAAPPQADACVLHAHPGPAVVLTADCLPILLASSDGSVLAAVHAGWRGLAAGVIEATLAQMPSASDLHAWMGPAIGMQAFEIGPEVRSALLQADPGALDAFRRGRGDRWHADLQALASRRLRAAGLHHIAHCPRCTCRDAALHSYRRDGQASGRMATLMWRTLTRSAGSRRAARGTGRTGSAAAPGSRHG